MSYYYTKYPTIMHPGKLSKYMWFTRRTTLPWYQMLQAIWIYNHIIFQTFAYKFLVIYNSYEQALIISTSQWQAGTYFQCSYKMCS